MCRSGKQENQKKKQIYKSQKEKENPLFGVNRLTAKRGSSYYMNYDDELKLARTSQYFSYIDEAMNVQ